MSDLKNFFTLFMMEHDTNYSEIAKLLGCSRQYITNITGLRTPLPQRLIDKLDERFGLEDEEINFLRQFKSINKSYLQEENIRLKEQIRELKEQVLNGVDYNK